MNPLLHGLRLFIRIYLAVSLTMVSPPSFFQLKRGVRQGDPLSPYLFIIALKLLAINIQNNDQIRGIKVDGNEIKLVIFADDMTTFVRDTVSFSHLVNTGTIHKLFRIKNES